MGLEDFLHRRDIPDDIKDAIMKDVHERKRLKKALISAEEKLRCLIEQNVAGIYVIHDGKFTYVNQKLADTLGYTVEELRSMDSILDVIAEEDRLRVAENMMMRLFGTVKSTRYALKARKKDGTLINVEVHGTKTDYDGKPAIIGVAIEMKARL